MSSEPPPFQESARCDVCKCSFNAFRRRHHCRCCGRTLCHEHSSNQMALPQFGIHSAVRVCADCFNDSSRSRKDDPQTYLDGVNRVVDSVSELDIGGNVDSKSESTAEHHPVLGVSECKCGMPLCICQAPAPAPAPALAPPGDTLALPRKTTSTSTQLNPKPKKTDNPKNRGSTSNSNIGSVFNLGQATNSSLDKPQMDYEVNGEAAVFNQTDITFTLMENGASLDCKNAQGETPLDCAPATLQYKMRKKMEEGER
ncbi:hypothetical protein L1049_013352 [Liquidambar formosana]|uniref:FYVE-type domain-containing protein n=1 Tax=Liquidambar formosana TaxID=63359 RepID=A0AAP0RKE9_LIQFO